MTLVSIIIDAKCKTGTNGEQFQKLSRNRSQSRPDEKQFPDLRNNIPHDLSKDSYLPKELLKDRFESSSE